MSLRLSRAVAVNALILLVLSSCASTAVRPEAPTIAITQTSEPSSMPGIDMAGGLPVEYTVHVVNSLDMPVKLVSVEIETFGSAGAYHLNQVRHAFSRTIGPHSFADVGVRAWVNVLSRSMTGDVVSAVTIRGSARFESPAGVLRRSFVQRVR
jgi:hypothetical protein